MSCASHQRGHEHPLNESDPNYGEVLIVGCPMINLLTGVFRPGVAKQSEASRGRRGSPGSEPIKVVCNRPGGLIQRVPEGVAISALLPGGLGRKHASAEAIVRTCRPVAKRKGRRNPATDLSDRSPVLVTRSDLSKQIDDPDLEIRPSLGYFADVSMFSPKNFQAFPSNFAILKM